MTKEFEHLMYLIETKKEKCLSKEEQEKLNEAESLLKIEGIFFKLDISTALGLLYFIGVPKDNLKGFYTKLTSIEEFKKSNQTYNLIQEDILKSFK